MKNPIKQLVGQTAVYGLGIVLPRLLNYLLLTPFYTRVFERATYGIITELYAYVVFLLVLLTYVLTPWAVQYWQSEDPSQFVLDEVIGFLCVPVFFPQHDFFLTAVFGFILFRVLDMIKVPPANIVDKRIKGWFGIIFDDVISAGYAAMILYALKYFNLITAG